MCTRGSSVERSALTSRAEEADRGEMRLERGGRRGELGAGWSHYMEPLYEATLYLLEALLSTV